MPLILNQLDYSPLFVLSPALWSETFAVCAAKSIVRILRRFQEKAAKVLPPPPLLLPK